MMTTPPRFSHLRPPDNTASRQPIRSRAPVFELSPQGILCKRAGHFVSARSDAGTAARQTARLGAEGGPRRDLLRS